jgi:coenzyme F420-reducing hydrogenase alpha subunit
MYYHWARAIGLLYACERTVQLLEDPALCDAEVRTPAQRHAGEGVGIVEAPRGLLIHHYAADERGRLTKVNLIVATCHNNAAMNLSVAQAARAFIRHGEVREGLLNRIEMALRAYDPCLSCATHTLGGTGLTVEIHDSAGQLLRTVRRE